MKSILSAPLLVMTLALLPACGPSAGETATSRRPETAMTIAATAPRGDVAWPFAFEWTTDAPPTAICRVSVFDAAERQLFQWDSKSRRLAAPEDLARLLPTSRTFLWRVSVLGDNGDAIAQSALTEFTVR